MQTSQIIDFLHFSHPTTEQIDVLHAMDEFIREDNKLDFFILCGAAGTGKTSITAALIGYLNSQKRQYRIAAPTGRAARILGRKAKTTTTTIHSLIYKPKSDSETGKVTFNLKKGFNSTPIIYIVDEASMIPKEVDKSEGLFEMERGLLFDLVSYIKGGNVENKILFLGDKYQLPPIGEAQSFALNEAFLITNFNFKGVTYILTEVKRQTDGSYILENATDIRKAIDERKSQHPISGTQSRSIYSSADHYVKDLKTKGLENSVAIGVSHKANKFFNDLVRERIFGQAKKIIEPGDLLMVTQNWHRNDVNLYNGDHVELLSVDWRIQEQVAGLHFVTLKIRLLFSEEETIVEDYAIIESIITPGGKIDNKSENELRRQRYTKNKIFRESNLPSDDRYVGALRLMYGHAITCNKAQGGEWKKVLINTMGIPSLKWQYTAVTRGIEEIEKF
jgi:ATP-dependent exoDNAse (exonuclease V) alpha subunit